MLREPEARAESTDKGADRMLAAARGGSNRAWAALLERVDPQGRLLAHLVLGGHDVDATLQSAYVRAYRARRKGTDDAVVLILNHVWMACGHEIRRRQRREVPAPGRRPQRDDRASRLGPSSDARTLAGLRPEERAVWVLVDRAGLPVATVAAALGVDERVITGVEQRVLTHLEEARSAEDHEPDHEPDDEPDDEPASEPASEPDDEPASDVDLEPVDEATVAHEVDLDLTDDEAVDASDDDDAAADAVAADDEGAGSLEPTPATSAFWQALGRRLKEERDAVAAAPPPSLPDPDGPSPALTQAPAPPVAMQKRAPRRARRKQADLVEGLADEADRQRPRRSWAALLVKVAAVVVVIGILAAAVFALYNAASTARPPVRGDSTADVSARSMGVLADAGTWSATVERTVEGEADATFTVQANQDGSYRISDESISRITTYDADFGVVRDTIPGFPSRSEQGAAPGGPDPSPPRADLPIAGLATAARALSTETDTEPEDTEVDGRKVRSLTGMLDEDTEITYLVDDETLLPFRVTWTRGDATVRELRFRDVTLGVGGVEYSQELPADTPGPTDLGFLPVPLGEVQARTELSPLTPDYLPGGSDGFEFTGAFVDEAERVVSLRYASGPRQMIITLRPSPVEAGQTWEDPFDRGDVPVTPEAITLDAGPFRDVPAQMVAGGATLPSLWAADGEIAVTVAGDLSAEDLQEVATSLG